MHHSLSKESRAAAATSATVAATAARYEVGQLLGYEIDRVGRGQSERVEKTA